MAHNESQAAKQLADYAKSRDKKQSKKQAVAAMAQGEFDSSKESSNSPDMMDESDVMVAPATPKAAPAPIRAALSRSTAKKSVPTKFRETTDESHLMTVEQETLAPAMPTPTAAPAPIRAPLSRSTAKKSVPTKLHAKKRDRESVDKFGATVAANIGVHKAQSLGVVEMKRTHQGANDFEGEDETLLKKPSMQGRIV